MTAPILSPEYTIQINRHYLIMSGALQIVHQGFDHSVYLTRTEWVFHHPPLQV